MEEIGQLLPLLIGLGLLLLLSAFFSGSETALCALSKVQIERLRHQRGKKIKNMVHEVIDLFGVDRCMFASNYPVEMVQGISIETLYGKFLSWTESMSETERSALFHDTATRVYKINGK